MTALSYWLRSPDTERPLAGDGSDTDIAPGRQRISDMGVADSIIGHGGDAPRIDTTKTAKPSRAHEFTVGLTSSPCTITREEWLRRNA